jgi:hypothetical protein
MRKPNPDQMDLFAWAETRPTAEIIDITPIIVRLMPDVDLQYPEPAKVISFENKRERSAA